MGAEQEDEIRAVGGGGRYDGRWVGLTDAEAGDGEEDKCAWGPVLEFVA